MDEKTKAIINAIATQRNNAMDAVAAMAGEIATLQAENTALKTELEKLKGSA